MSTAAAPSAFPRFDAQEATWPALERAEIGDGAWRARWTEGAGHRVASARPLTHDHAALEASIDAIAAFYEARRADTLFQLPNGPIDAVIGGALVKRGFVPEAPTDCLAASIAAVAARPLADPAHPYWIDPTTPLAAIDALWDDGGIGLARRAVMARAPLGRRIGVRRDNLFVGAAFVGLAAPNGAVAAVRGAVLHALYVAPEMRRRGAGRDATIGGARWALATLGGDAEYFIDVEAANHPAQAAYAALGADRVDGYRYFRKRRA